MNSKNYWKRRALLLEQLLNTRADATVQQISRLYGLAQEQIFQQIEKVFSSYVRGGALNPDKAMQLLTVRETEEARALLLEQYQRATGQVKRDIWARLSAPAYANRIERLQALRDSLYIQARMVGLDEVSYVRDRLSDTLEQSYYRTTFDIQQYTGEGYDFSLLNDNQITAALAADWSGKNWSERLWDNNQRFADAVEDTVTVGIMAGLRYDEMRDNLLHVIGMDETEGAKYRAARLVKTECAYIANQGHLLGYQAAEIERYIFLATLDLRTSEVCRSLDMKRFSVAEAQAGENLPPMHPHCRSTTMPDMTDEQLRKVSRAARDPATGKGITVPGDMKYRDWYKKFVEGHPQAQAREKAVKNKAADREQFRRYRAVLGENVPKTLDDFQKLKYTDDGRWKELKLAKQDAEILSDIRARRHYLNIRAGKLQQQHLIGSRWYDPTRSHFTEGTTDEDLLAMLELCAGTGEIQHGRNYPTQIQEIVDVGMVIGETVNAEGIMEPTTKVKIHYSKKGVHLVPYSGK